MKTCTCCGLEKALTEFNKKKQKKDGLSPWCKKCASEKTRNYYQKNKEKVSNSSSARYFKNKEVRDSYMVEWRKNNKSKMRALSAKKRASILERTPKWLSQEHIEAIKVEYELAYWCSTVMGSQYHVDHIVPLQGKTVSGLHVPWNLRVIPAKDNLSKGNKWQN